MSRLIVFDVDSTLLQVESLDFAVARALKAAPDGSQRAQRLSAITDKGMAGALDFRASLEQRIAIAGLTRHDIMPASVALADLITPGMDALTEALRAKGHGVFAVSGGFLELLGPALATLGFMPDDVRANRFTFDDTGAVTGFDRDNPLSRSGGKAEVVRALKSRTGAGSAVMVGDGMTDYEAFADGAADAFIGFGGVVAREPVRARAPAWAGDVDALAKLLGA
ncbi:HAD-IB family phosphatase [Alkalicaulis satelles]|uniref:phosphoserine phosphatase n=1 Tax=Alkalicaulis satelles TaxID=2609175 RepID=A0A5M6ZKQ7_9PROT|nr:HAD-IB family phosphatase [Alkalicaulis satelles]KAA5805432.1 HAD-IB family phosphatase [Alkalicaulis satelles]